MEDRWDEGRSQKCELVSKQNSKHTANSGTLWVRTRVRKLTRRSEKGQPQHSTARSSSVNQ
eukprot:3218224-Pleurochrysis_carterae.AAC.1